MEYKYSTKEPDYPHKFKCKNEEADAVRAMYLEQANQRIRNGNTNFLDKGFYKYVAESVMFREEEFSFTTGNLDELARQLENFAEKSEEEAAIIAELGTEADFESTTAIKRVVLGKVAASLALEVRNRIIDEKDAQIHQQVDDVFRDLGLSMPDQ
jgi:hypothetical protein